MLVSRQLSHAPGRSSATKAYLLASPHRSLTNRLSRCSIFRWPSLRVEQSKAAAQEQVALPESSAVAGKLWKALQWIVPLSMPVSAILAMWAYRNAQVSSVPDAQGPSAGHAQ